VVCPNCGDELAVGKDEIKQQIWVVKSCGHVSVYQKAMMMLRTSKLIMFCRPIVESVPRASAQRVRARKAKARLWIQAYRLRSRSVWWLAARSPRPRRT
jgi:hypothetical protein